MATIETKFGNLDFGASDRLYNYTNSGQTIGVQMKVNGQEYTYIPSNIVEKGFVKDGKQYYLGNVIVGDNLKALGTEGQYINLEGIKDYDKYLADRDLSTTGFLLPSKVAQDRKLLTSVRNYDVAGKDIGAGMSAGAIKGISLINEKPVYVTEPKGKAQSTWIQPPGTAGYDGQGATGSHQGRYTYTRSNFGAVGRALGDVAQAIAGVPFLPEIIGFMTGSPMTTAAIRGASAGASGQDPLKAGLLAGVSAAGVQAGLNVQAGLDPITGLPRGVVGGTPGVSEVYAVTPPGGTAAPLAPAAPGSAGAGMLGADAAFVSDYATTLAGQGINEAAIVQNLVEAGVAPAEATLAANLATSGASQATIANTLATTAPAGSTSLFTGGTAADLAAAGITAGGVGVAMTPAQIAAGGAAGAGAAAGAGGAAASAGGGLLSNVFGQAAGGFLTDLLGAGINYGIDEATINRLTNLAERRRNEVQSQFNALAEQSQVPFTPYTVSTGFGTSTFGPQQATTALSPEYANIRQQALTGATEALGSINPATATQDYFNTLEALSAPTRQREQERLLGTLGNRGLLGFGQNMPTAGGMTRTVNPLMESLLSSQATERLQQSLAAQQYGVADAQRRAGLSSSLLGMGTGLDTTAANQLASTATLGQIPYSIDVANRERQLQLQRAGLVAGMPYDEAVFNLAAGREQGLGNFYRQGAESLFNEIFR